MIRSSSSMDWGASNGPPKPPIRSERPGEAVTLLDNVVTESPWMDRSVSSSAMEKRRLGQTNLDVSVLGFGGSEIGYEGASRATVARLLGGALDAGLTVIDTAECYERSEELIGG